MAKIGFLLTEGPWQTENHKVFTKLASAALDAGHEVQTFWYLDGVCTPIMHQTFPAVEADELPASDTNKVAEKGSKIIVRGICVNGRGKNSLKA
jgi:tRNA 2-thiouridine synthesizing protein D